MQNHRFGHTTVPEYVDTLRKHNLVSANQATQLTNPMSLDAQSREALVAHLVRQFNQADRSTEQHSPETVGMLQACADAVDALKDIPAEPERPSLAAAGAMVPGNRHSAPVAGGQLGAITASGSPTGLSDTANDLTLGMHGLDVGQEYRVSTRLEYPPERVLGFDPGDTTAKIDAVCGVKALTASGGICGPLGADYAVFGISTDERPVRDALARFAASRGGIRFMTAPRLSDAAGAVGLWTAATDANPGGSTKAVMSLSCGSEQVATVDAVTMRLQIGNMYGQFQPEQVAGWVELAHANHSRLAETTLLNKIAAASTSVSTGQLLGATRDLLTTLDQASAAYRYRHRVPRAVRLRAIVPDWIKDMMRADLSRQLVGDESLSVSDAQLDAYFAVRGVTVSYALDGQPARSSGLPYPVQGFGAQAANAVLADWPRWVTWYLFAEGSFQFLDGRTLDVGVVRDSSLNDQNNYEMFYESFEGLAFRGVESLQLISQLRPNGASAGTVSTAAY